MFYQKENWLVRYEKNGVTIGSGGPSKLIRVVNIRIIAKVLNCRNQSISLKNLRAIRTESVDVHFKPFANKPRTG